MNPHKGTCTNTQTQMFTHAHIHSHTYKDPQPASAFRGRSLPTTLSQVVVKCDMYTSCRITFQQCSSTQLLFYHSADIHTVIITDPNRQTYSFLSFKLKYCVHTACILCIISVVCIKFELCIFIFLWHLADREISSPKLFIAEWKKKIGC